MSWKTVPCGKMYSGAMVLVGPVKTCFILFLLVHLSDFEKPLCANCYVCVRRKSGTDHTTLSAKCLLLVDTGMCY